MCRTAESAPGAAARVGYGMYAAHCGVHLYWVFQLYGESLRCDLQLRAPLWSITWLTVQVILVIKKAMGCSLLSLVAWGVKVAGCFTPAHATPLEILPALAHDLLPSGKLPLQVSRIMASN